MLSRLQRRSDALDEACLRALGHPNDHAIRKELLSALEWEDSLRPVHAHSLLRETFREVHGHSVDLAVCIQIGADSPEAAAHAIQHGALRLRQSLAALVVMLTARHQKPE